MNNFIIYCGSGFIGSHLVREPRHHDILNTNIADLVYPGCEPSVEFETGLQRFFDFFTAHMAAVRV